MRHLVVNTRRTVKKSWREAILFGSLLTSLSCDPFGTEFAAIESAIEYRAVSLSDAAEPTDSLLLMTYNVKFGGGRIDFFFDCHGDRVLMTREEVIENLRGVAGKIRQVDPDVLFLQEVDVNSKRSAFVDQLQWLLDHTELNYAVYASQWRADFVPSDGLGAVDSGNAILSRWPLSDGTRIALAEREDLSSIERYFYLRRNLLSARLDIAGKRLYLLGVHAESYAQDGTKRKHVDRFKEELDALASEGVAIGAGDLNALPPFSEQLSGFDDSACRGEFEADDFSAETDWLEPLFDDYQEAIPLQDYRADNAPYATHSTSKDVFWNRRLDYIFSSGEFAAGSGLVHQDQDQGGVDTMVLSDHAPLSVRLELP